MSIKPWVAWASSLGRAKYLGRILVHRYRFAVSGWKRLQINPHESTSPGNTSPSTKSGSAKPADEDISKKSVLE